MDVASVSFSTLLIADDIVVQNQDGKCTRTEAPRRISSTDLFNNLDADKSKSIGKEELTKFLQLQKVDLSADQIDSVISQFGENDHLDDNGEIPYDTFVAVVTGRLTNFCEGRLRYLMPKKMMFYLS